MPPRAVCARCGKPISTTWRPNSVACRLPVRGITAPAAAIRARNPFDRRDSSRRSGRRANGAGGCSVRSVLRIVKACCRGGSAMVEKPAICGVGRSAGGPASRNACRTATCIGGATRGDTFESRASCDGGMVFGFSRRRIRLATLLASKRRSIPERSRNWFRCSREQKSPPSRPRIDSALFRKIGRFCRSFCLNYRPVID